MEMKTTVFSLLLFLMISACTVKRQKEGVATLVEIRSYVRGGSTEWTFYDDKGKKYRIESGHGDGDLVGMKYVIIYDSLHPDLNNQIIPTHPVFIHGEKTVKTVCTIIRRGKCYPSRGDNEIVFEYHVNGRYYENYQQIRPRKDTICYNVGDKFEGEYWQENPKRVIIYLDKPVK
jgi:hypothetical protein